jgi:UDP-galactopyranose mutase
MKGIFRKVVVSTSVNERGYVVSGHILEYYEKPMKRSSEFKHLEKGGCFLHSSVSQEYIKSIENKYRSYLESILNPIEK